MSVSSMKITTLSLILTIAIIAFVLVMVTATIFVIIRHKKSQRTAGKPFRTIVTVSGIMTVVCTIMLTVGFVNYKTAQKHGLRTKNITLAEMTSGIANSPEEDELPTDLTGAVVIYYKFGCEDCEAVYPELSELVSNNQNIYWVSTESEQGKTLLEKYPVNNVPSGIYIRQDSFGGNIPYTSKLLYTIDENGNTVIDEAAVNRLLYLQSESR